MTGSGKTLTVSYGTFSCTLEGFDDAFATMKAITEYFRQLSAEDRYFGAVPPRPDAGELQRIAERESHHKVDARVHDRGVTLRPSVQAKAAPASPPRTTESPKPAATAAAAQVNSPAPAPGQPAESVAARLARLRSKVAQSRPPEKDNLKSIFADDPDDDANDSAAPATPLLGSDLDGDQITPAKTASGTQTIGDAAGSVAPQRPASPPQEAEAPKAAEHTPAERPATAQPEPQEPPSQPAQMDETSEFEDESEDIFAEMTPEPGQAQPQETPRPVAQDSAKADAVNVEDKLRRMLTPQAETGETPAPPLPAADAPEAPPREMQAEPAPAEPSPEKASEEQSGVEDGKPRQRSGRSILEETEPLEEDDVTRLVETANSRLEVAENKRRLSAISHLRAAVAATVAERVMGRNGTGEEANKANTMDRYRDDLSRVVQGPRKAEAPVADQIDEDDEDDAQEPIVPRRPGSASADERALAMQQAEELSAKLSFVNFAEAAGARELPELLEAAAAFLAVHEGQEVFSRPQIMRKVALITPEEEFTREEGLRSFGALLRQGRLQKVRRGQFTIAEDSRFRERIVGAAE